MFPGHIAQSTPDKLAVVMAQSGFTYTYKELDDAANRFSQALANHGLKPGDHVALCLENHDRYFEVVWGCHYAGLVYTACSSRLTSDELAYILNDCGAKAFITSKYKADQAQEISSQIRHVDLRLMLDGVIDGFDSFEDLVAQHPSEPLPNRKEGADMLYSSGTTGRPKGVKLHLADNPLGTAPPLVGLGQFLLGMTSEMVYLSPAPLYHAAPLRWNLVVHRLGGTSVIMEHFDAEQFLQCIEKYAVTHSQTVPTMFIRLLKLDP